MGSVVRRTRDGGLWLPFVVVGVVKVLLLFAMARFDLLPAFLVAAALQIAPQVADSLRYPQVVLHLPDVARHLDLVLFVTLGAVVQGWAIAHLTRTWTGRDIALVPDFRRGTARIVALVVLSGFIALVPFATRFAAQLLSDRMLAAWIALSVGLGAQILLFCAPAFRIIDDLSIAQSVRRSIAVVRRFPVAVPCAIALLAAVHAPALILRAPAILAGSKGDPEWILAAILGQAPFDVAGAFFATAFATRFALSSQVRRPSPAEVNP